METFKEFMTNTGMGYQQSKQMVVNQLAANLSQLIQAGLVRPDYSKNVVVIPRNLHSQLGYAAGRGANTTYLRNIGIYVPDTATGQIERPNGDIVISGEALGRALNRGATAGMLRDVWSWFSRAIMQPGAGFSLSPTTATHGH